MHLSKKGHVYVRHAIFGLYDSFITRIFISFELNHKMGDMTRDFFAVLISRFDLFLLFQQNGQHDDDVKCGFKVQSRVPHW